MFKSTDYVQNINEIPSAWIFSNYLKIKLTGQSVKIKSIFNENDSKPSLIIYYRKDKGKYVFKDFSSGISGSAVDFMMKYWNMPFSKTKDKIMEDYKNSDFKEDFDSELTYQGWKVTEFKVREWNNNDLEYWNSYKISKSLLLAYNIKPLSFYKMSLFNDKEIIDEFIVKKPRVYGYFYGIAEGNLAKIYQPEDLDKKFIKVTNYIQGSDQNKNNKFLIIASSLKDILALVTIGIRADFIAPDSENTLLSESVIKRLKRSYKDIITIFDNDLPGIKAMQRYKELYNIPFCYLPFEKDPAEILKNNSISECQIKIVPKINKILNNE